MTKSIIPVKILYVIQGVKNSFDKVATADFKVPICSQCWPCTFLHLGCFC